MTDTVIQLTARPAEISEDAGKTGQFGEAVMKKVQKPMCRPAVGDQSGSVSYCTITGGGTEGKLVYQRTQCLLFTPPTGAEKMTACLALFDNPKNPLAHVLRLLWQRRRHMIASCLYGQAWPEDLQLRSADSACHHRSGDDVEATQRRQPIRRKNVLTQYCFRK